MLLYIIFFQLCRAFKSYKFQLDGIYLSDLENKEREKEKKNNNQLYEFKSISFESYLYSGGEFFCTRRKERWLMCCVFVRELLLHNSNCLTGILLLPMNLAISSFNNWLVVFLKHHKLRGF
jgi:hypothetical protein